MGASKGPPPHYRIIFAVIITVCPGKDKLKSKEHMFPGVFKIKILQYNEQL
jgi:hypothetical protein